MPQARSAKKYAAKSHKRHSAAIMYDSSGESYRQQMRPGNHHVCCGTAKEKHEYPICSRCSVSDGTSTR